MQRLWTSLVAIICGVLSDLIVIILTKNGWEDQLAWPKQEFTIAEIILFFVVGLILIWGFFSFIRNLSVFKIGLLPFSTGCRFFVPPNKKDSEIVRIWFRNFIKLSKEIKIVWINGRQFLEESHTETDEMIWDLLQDFKGKEGYKIKFFLLDPDSKFAEERAKELSNDEGVIREFLERHERLVRKIVKEIGMRQVYLYDEKPQFQIMKFCKNIFVCNYNSLSRAKNAIMKGYCLPDHGGQIANGLRWIYGVTESNIGEDYYFYAEYVRKLEEKYKPLLETSKASKYDESNV